MRAQDKTVGALQVLASAALFALAGVFTKVVSADPWTVSGWRGLIGCILMTAYYFWERRRANAPISLKLGGIGWFFVLLSAVTQLFYIASLKYTFVANVAVIYAITPFVAAGLAWLFIRERVRRITILTAALSMSGVMVIVTNGMGSGHSFGDLMALGMTLTFAIYMVALRAYPRAPVLLAVSVAALLLFVLSLFTSRPLAVSPHDLKFLILFGVTFSLAVILFTEGARRLPVAETALIGTMDVPFAASFAWLFIGERPPVATLLGGAIVVAALAFQSTVDLATTRRQMRRPEKT